MFGFFRRRSTPEIVDQTAPPYFGRLAMSMILIGAANLSLWCNGIRQQDLRDAIEIGAASIDDNAKGDVEEDQIRESIRLQRQSEEFWSTLAILGDFIIEPIYPALRALIVTVAFASVAAVFGRPVGYGVALADNMSWQIFWAAGIGLECAMRILISPDAENSLAVFMPAKEYPAATALALAILNPFAICGWLAIGWTTWKRKQANWFLVILLILMIAGMEVGIRSRVLAMMGALMRLAIGVG